MVFGSTRPSTTGRPGMIARSRPRADAHYNTRQSIPQLSSARLATVASAVLANATNKERTLSAAERIKASQASKSPVREPAPKLSMEEKMQQRSEQARQRAQAEQEQREKEEAEMEARREELHGFVKTVMTKLQNQDMEDIELELAEALTALEELEEIDHGNSQVYGTKGTVLLVLANVTRQREYLVRAIVPLNRAADLGSDQNKLQARELLTHITQLIWKALLATFVAETDFEQFDFEFLSQAVAVDHSGAVCETIHELACAELQTVQNSKFYAPVTQFETLSQVIAMCGGGQHQEEQQMPGSLASSRSSTKSWESVDEAAAVTRRIST